YLSGSPHVPHSFPTRRSSDLRGRRSARHAHGRTARRGGGRRRAARLPRRGDHHRAHWLRQQHRVRALHRAEEAVMPAWLPGIFWMAGSTLCLLAAVGVLRMPDIFTRMQAGSKASTFGLAFLLIGTALDIAEGATVARALLIAAFIMLTTPVAAHAVARAAYLTYVPLWP